MHFMSYSDIRLFPGLAAYLLVLMVAVADFVWLWLSGMALPWQQLIGPGITIAIELFLVWYLGRAMSRGSRHEQLFHLFRILLKSLVFLQLAWIFVRLFN